ncbi:U-box domain-containing protein 33-like [Oryza brachyantha]|uniref:RING-type E3 ubiquitin transferase n=1 Tax=Oryza brachyantha TaxID=4533 RepID=J3LFL6_ORYBR|nr:U-box domain-containing protein 33-like [Oryza brachyantha]
MDGDGGVHDGIWSARCSVSSSSGSLLDAADDWDEQSLAADEDKVFVAVEADVEHGRSTFLWALQNLAARGSKIVVAHVHSSAQEISKIHCTSMKPEEISEYLKLAREEAEKNLDEYALIAKSTGKDMEIACEKVIIVMDDIAKGLEELITLHGITRLVMGAAADQYYSEEMKEPNSKIALKLMETASPSCKIWFTCNAHLICTREPNENLLAIYVPPAQTNTKPLSVCSISSQMSSIELENEAPSSEEYTLRSLVQSTMSEWDYIFGDWGRIGYGSFRTDDPISISEATTLAVIVDGTNKQSSVMHSPQESDSVNFLLPVCDPEQEEEEQNLYDDMRGKLKEACTRAELLKEEVHSESSKRRKAEMDLLIALQRVKESEKLYLQEGNQRKETEKTLARQRLEIDEIKRRHNALYDELQDTKKQKLVLEQHISEIKSAATDYVQKITEYFIQESCEEAKKRQKIKMDLLAVLQRVKDVENLNRNEKMQRKDMEEKIARQRMEIEETKRQRDELYHELKDVKEQKFSLEQVDASEETRRRRKAESDMLSALQRVHGLEHQYLHELKKREALDETLARQREEIQETKRELNKINGIHMTEIKSIRKVHEEKLAESKRFIQEIQAKYDKLLHERDTAIAESEKLRQMNRNGASITATTQIPDFSFFELRQATQDFDTALKIGTGRFMSVYKGFLRNTAVTVTLLHHQGLQGQSEFHQEVAVLSRLRHPNLMTLIGACPEAFGMVYEFLPNGSLEDQLSCEKNTPPLTWKARTRIIGEICSALTFIHSHKPHPVVHGNLNPMNILLDANFVSKLHICQILRKYNTGNNTYGTSSYIDPEFLSTGELAPRCDVYSFGIIILRLLTGQPPENITTMVEDAMEKSQLHSIMDTSAGSWPFVQANQLAHLGLRCANLSGRHRPDLTGEVWGVIKPLLKAAYQNHGCKHTFEALSDETHMPSYFICPILQEVMTDPHIAADGYTYEADAIREWLDGGNARSPMTNLRLEHRELTPNRVLRSAILEWRHQQQQHKR